jgi:Sec-independent protein translocase protein TatA
VAAGAARHDRGRADGAGGRWPRQQVANLPDQQVYDVYIAAEDIMSARRWRDRLPENWMLLVIGLPAAVVVWSGWVGLGTMCGFGDTYPLPGLAPHFKIDTTFTLPVGMEAYAVYAMGAALGSQGETTESKRAREFAKWSAIGALVAGMIAQVSYHLLTAAHKTQAPSLVVAFVACLPVATIALGAWLAHLKHAARKAETELAAKQDREKAKQSEHERSALEDAERQRQHELQLEQLRLAAAERERQDAADAGRERLAERERRRLAMADRLGALSPSRGGSVSPGVTAAVLHAVSPDDQPPPEAGATTPERRAMWSFWVRTIRNEQRVPTGEELRIAGGCGEESSLGRRMARQWKLLEPAVSLLRGEATG